MHLLTLALSFLLIMGSPVITAALSSCAVAQAPSAAGCPPPPQETREHAFTGETLTLTASRTQHAPQAPRIASPGRRSAHLSVTMAAAPAEPPCVDAGLTRCPIIVNVPTDPTPAPAPAATAADPITIDDIARFAPNPTPLTTQPTGWTLKNLPTNLIADPTTHTTTATLLNTPITIRWTPTTYTFTHGDGTTNTTTHPGTPWTTPDTHFTPTPTTHTYTRTGTTTATLTTTYTAHIHTPTGWTPIPGTLTRTTPPTTLTIHTAHATLTRTTCTTHPHDPGCTP